MSCPTYQSIPPPNISLRAMGPSKLEAESLTVVNFGYNNCPSFCSILDAMHQSNLTRRRFDAPCLLCKSITSGRTDKRGPKHDTGFRKNIRNRHEGRTDYAKGMFNAMHLQNFHKGFFSGHFHRGAGSGLEFIKPIARIVSVLLVPDYKGSLGGISSV